MKVPMPRWLATAIIKRAVRTPYSHLEGYMNRYWIVPFREPSGGDGCGPVSPWRRPFAWALQRFDIGVRVHQILRSDEDPWMHSHPWNFVSVLLHGRYIEERPDIDIFGRVYYNYTDFTPYRTGDVLIRKATDVHSLKLPDGPVWTLFITGSYQRRWGFMNPDTGVETPYPEYFAQKAQKKQDRFDAALRRVRDAVRTEPDHD